MLLAALICHVKALHYSILSSVYMHEASFYLSSSLNQLFLVVLRKLMQIFW